MKALGHRDGFFIESLEIPGGEFENGLYGPLCGDAPVQESEVVYGKRGERPYDSRLVNRPMRKTTTLTVVAGPHDGQSCVLFTVYGGPYAPREVNDPFLKEEEKAASVAFWANHAIVNPRQ